MGGGEDQFTGMGGAAETVDYHWSTQEMVMHN